MRHLSKRQLQAIHASKKPITAYDVKAGQKVKILHPKLTTMKTGMLAWHGKSAKTGIDVYRIIGKSF